jgi:two-component system cell cycle response regulator
MKILVADDEVISRRLLQNSLERSGYDVIAVENGRLAAEQLCQPDGPRLALLDWIMPELDGPGVCRQVRARRQESYVHMILLTSRETKQDIVAGLEAGADDYVIKPCHPEELKARLRTGQRILQLEDRLVEAREDMRFKASHDSLTSLFNRGVIMDLLSRELARTTRENGCTTVLLSDIDYFKRINDKHGHLTGDEVLKEIARRLLGAIRSYDLAARYGGEEFLVVLNNCETTDALSRAEGIRKAIAEHPVQTTLGPLQVTMSFGVLGSRDFRLRPLGELLQAVDSALYASKKAGRNCCTLAEPESISDVHSAIHSKLSPYLID